MVRAGLAVAAVVAIASFLQVSQLGLYEDDYLYSRLWGVSWASLSAELKVQASYGGDNGRLLGVLVMYVLSRLGQSLVGCYALAYLLHVATGLAVWAWLRRLLSPAAAAGATAFFLLYPADTAKFLLVRSFHVYPALLLFALGAWSYQRRQRWWPYLCYFLSLLIYEVAALPFFCLAAFGPEPRKHVLKTGAALGLLVAWRSLVNSGRLGEVRQLGLSEALAREAVALSSGPWTSLQAALQKPGLGLGEADPLGCLAGLAVAALVLGWMQTQAGDDDEAHCRPPASWLGWGGLGMWVSSYALMITNERFPPVQEVGRLTSTHSGGALGAALLFGLGLQWLWCQSRGAARVMALYLGMVATYQVHQQQVYAALWSLQQDFWRQVAELTPDLRADLTVVCVVGRLREQFPSAYPWTLPLIPSQILDFSAIPAERQPLVVFFEGHIQREADVLMVKPLPYEEARDLRLTPVIALRAYPNGQLRRLERLQLSGLEVELVPRVSGKGWNGYQPGILARYLR